MARRMQDVRLEISFPNGRPVVTLGINGDEGMGATGLGAIVKGRPEVNYNRDRVQANGKKGRDGIELRFGNARPTEQVRAMLKEHGFRFSSKQLLWYAPDNEKARQLAVMLANQDIDIDDTVYEKLHFWARVKSTTEYAALRNSTEFMVKEVPARFFNTKRALESSGLNTAVLVRSGKLSFKKFYNRVVGEGEEGEEPGSGDGDDMEKDDGEAGGDGDDGDGELELLELEAEAELELLQMRVEAQRRKAGGLSGFDKPTLARLRSKAWAMQAGSDVLGFK